MSESFPTDAGRVLVFQAHPDDEVFTTAAAMLAVVAAGGTVTLLVATGGELGEQMADPTLDLETARRLRAARLTESCRILGVDWEPLTEPGRWIDGETGNLAEADTAEVAAEVRKAIDRYEPDLVLTVGPNGITGHPDHRAMFAAVTAALTGSGWKPRRALGAVLREVDLAAAAQVVPFPDGKERLTGIPAEDIAVRVDLPSALAPRHREAMNVYHAGLGTMSLDELIANGLGGGALALRAIFDAADGMAEYYVDIPISFS
jgi:N-acetyl-1-D-myo-inositol-2-amino-2-deoxy-alpha-D-glucopyranoside deacetylase